MKREVWLMKWLDIRPSEYGEHTNKNLTYFLPLGAKNGKWDSPTYFKPPPSNETLSHSNGKVVFDHVPNNAMLRGYLQCRPKSTGPRCHLDRPHPFCQHCNLHRSRLLQLVWLRPCSIGSCLLVHCSCMWGQLDMYSHWNSYYQL